MAEVDNVPEEWRIARFMRNLPYPRDEHIERMIVRLARGTINAEKAEWLARAVHNTKGWAGTPVAFDDIGHFRPVGTKEADIARALTVLTECKSILDVCICAEPLREGDIPTPCPIHGWVGEPPKGT